MNNIILTQSHDHVTADSLMVAEHFGKSHKNVIQTIETLISQTSAEISANLFYESEYQDSYGRIQKNYLLPRDGFTLLGMGFTGAKALEWKLKYIAAFNAMESEIKKQNQPKPMSQLEILAATAQALVDQDKRITLVETKQTAMIDALTAPAMMDWANDMNQRINFICKTYSKNYQTYRHELYAQLEATARCNLTARQSRLRDRMKLAGHKHTEIMAVTKIHVIADDPKLRAIFEGIIRTEQVKYAGQEAV